MVNLLCQLYRLRIGWDIDLYYVWERFQRSSTEGRTSLNMGGLCMGHSPGLETRSKGEGEVSISFYPWPLPSAFWLWCSVTSHCIHSCTRFSLPWCIYSFKLWTDSVERSWVTPQWQEVLCSVPLVFPSNETLMLRFPQRESTKNDL